MCGAIPSRLQPMLGECQSDDQGHRLDHGRGDLPLVLGHDHDPQRLDTSAAPSEIGSIFGCHRHGGFLLLQALQHDIRPSSAQHSLDLALIHALMRDHHHAM